MYTISKFLKLCESFFQEKSSISVILHFYVKHTHNPIFGRLMYQFTAPTNMRISNGKEHFDIANR